MAVITEINGISTSGTTGVNNIFGSGGGGGGLSAPSLGTTSGIQTFGSLISSINGDLNSSFNRGEVGLTQYTSSDFVVIAAKRGYNTFMAVTNDGKLWYNTNTNSYMSGATTDSSWHEDLSNPVNTSGNWTWVSCDNSSAMAIRGGDICFRGYGNYRQRGDGSTGSTSIWVRTYDGSTDAAVRCYLGYRVAYMLTASGKIYSCGYRYEGMTGEGTTSGQQPTWTDITPSGRTVVDIGVAYRACKFIDDQGDVWSFGDNGQQTSGPLYTSNADIITPTQGTNNQMFAGGKILGGSGAKMWFIMDANNQVWMQGDGAGREHTTGNANDYKNNWTAMDSAGDYTLGSFVVNGESTSDNLSFFVKSDGAVVFSGIDGINLTASADANGTRQSGNPPYDMFTSASNDVGKISGNINRYLVTYG